MLGPERVRYLAARGPSGTERVSYLAPLGSSTLHSSIAGASPRSNCREGRTRRAPVRSARSSGRGSSRSSIPDVRGSIRYTARSFFPVRSEE
ncbi:hypothetical protein F2Q68_00034336 [Brassica cretica]|uniref:Uncharacterized protein n=1 Tax=Brassica cretica TaxID=69181 RepID=A0A8S9H068_BRACR|nr:hypothetical protein F2Q68_00034336 [Brassica cretica]